MYAKLNNGVIEYAPKNFITNNGQAIANFNKSEVLMKKFGYKEVKSVRPAYDSETQYIEVNGYKEYDEYIELQYIVLEKEDEVPSLEERVVALEEEVFTESSESTGHSPASNN